MYMIFYDTCVPYKPHNISVVSRAPMEVHHASQEIHQEKIESSHKSSTNTPYIMVRLHFWHFKQPLTDTKY